MRAAEVVEIQDSESRFRMVFFYVSPKSGEEGKARREREIREVHTKSEIHGLFYEAYLKQKYGSRTTIAHVEGTYLIVAGRD